MKKIVVALLAASVASIAAVGGYSLASTTSAGSQTYAVNHQQFQWRQRSASTTSTKFHNLKLASSPGAAQFIVARGPISATLSGTFKGRGRVRIRDGRRTFHPGPASFGPSRRNTSFSYTFVSHGSAKGRCHYVTVDWRSADGAPVTMKKAALVVTYREKAPPGPLTC